MTSWLHAQAEQASDRLWDHAETGGVAGPRDFDDIMEQLRLTVLAEVERQLVSLPIVYGTGSRYDGWNAALKKVLALVRALREED